MSRDCKHGQLARSCEICEKDKLISNLEALLYQTFPKNIDPKTTLISFKIDGCSKCSAIRLNANGEVVYDKSVNLKDERIAALENLVDKFLKLESSGTSVCQGVEESCCPYCQKEHFGSSEHEPNCLFITARAVREGKR